jgi:hypothetical protein
MHCVMACRISQQGEQSKKKMSFFCRSKDEFKAAAENLDSVHTSLGQILNEYFAPAGIPREILDEFYNETLLVDDVVILIEDGYESCLSNAQG